MNLLILIVLPFLLVVIVPCGYAQEGDVGSVLKQAQESLEAQVNQSSPQTSNITTAIPKNADIYLETKLSYNSDNTLWYFPSDAKLNFTKANKICPEKNCLQEFHD